MTVRSQVCKILQQEDLNFLLTNRIPRRLADPVRRLVQPDRAAAGARPLDRALAAVLRSRPERGEEVAFTSLHDCFIRELKDGARPVDPDPAVLASPCDAIVGACGTIAGTRAAPDQGPSLHAARTCWAIPSWSSATATAAMSRCGSPPACITASMRRMTAASSRSPTSPATPGTSIRSRSSGSRSCSARTSARCCARGCTRRPRRHAGAGRRHPGRQHPAAFPSTSARPRSSRAEAIALRRAVPQGRGDGLVPARLDHHRVRAATASRCARPCARARRIRMGQPLMRLP